jgi:glycosyltransferase involved in cell wall biosynthesis
MPQVTIGIPAHGRPTYLSEAIESVLNQTFGDWSLIVAEDGPGSAEISEVVQRYSDDPRVTHAPSTQHLGAPQTMNRILEKSETPIVAILHDDDRWDPAFLEQRVRFLGAHPECGFVFSPTVVIDKVGTETSRFRRILTSGVHHPAEMAPMMFRRNRVPPPTPVVRSAAYRAVGYFDTAYERIYDYDMWFRLCLRFPTGYLTEWDSAWRRHESQSTNVLVGRSAEYERFVSTSGSRMQRHIPEAAPSDRNVRRRLADQRLSIASDAVELQQWGVARSELVSAVRTYPPSAADVRAAAVAMSVIARSPGRATLRASRRLVKRHGVRVHLRQP